MANEYAPALLDDGDPRTEVIRSMVSDLGWCLSSYGRVEYLFGDLVWHARSIPDYSHLAAKQFPISLDGRLAELRSVLDLPGPYYAYKEDLLLLMERLEQLSEPRNMFAHGHTIFVYTAAGDAALQFRRFVPPPKGTKGGKPTKYEGIVRPNSLADARFSWVAFASTAQALIGSMYMALGLEEP